MYFILFEHSVTFVFKNPLRRGKIKKIAFQVRTTFNEMNIRTLTQLRHNKIAIINYYYTGMWGIPRLRNCVKSSGYSRVTSNFISFYVYCTQSKVSFLTVLGDERS